MKCMERVVSHKITSKLCCHAEEIDEVCPNHPWFCVYGLWEYAHPTHPKYRDLKG